MGANMFMFPFRWQRAVVSKRDPALLLSSGCPGSTRITKAFGCLLSTLDVHLK